MVHVMAVIADTPGVLRRITGLYGARGYRVQSFSAGPDQRPGKLRITLGLHEPPERARRFARQLGRLVDVDAVEFYEESESISRELALIKIAVDPERRPEIFQAADVFRARAIHVATEYLILEMTGDSEKIEAFLRILREFGEPEVARSGRVALGRNQEPLCGKPSFQRRGISPDAHTEENDSESTALHTTELSRAPN